MDSVSICRVFLGDLPRIGSRTLLWIILMALCFHSLFFPCSFQQIKNNLYLPCQFFENRRSICLFLFLPYDRSDRTFYSQTKVNSKTSKVIASRCYAWSLGIKKSLNRQGSVNQKENSSKSSA